MMLMALAITSTAFADTTNIKAYEMTGRVARGQTIRFLVRLVIGGKAAGAGHLLGIQERVGGPKATPRLLALCPTDAAGWVRYEYRVPADPRKDNIYLSACFGGRQGVGTPLIPSQSASVRVPIGK